MSELAPPNVKKSNWRGFTLQLFVLTILPLTALLLVVAFGSQTLHHEAMRSLVGDRDLRTVQAAASSIEHEVSDLTRTLQLIARGLDENKDFSALPLPAEEIAAAFDGGLAVFSQDGELIRASSAALDWPSLPAQIPEQISAPDAAISPLLTPAGASQPYLILSTRTAQQNVLLAAFSPNALITNAVGSLSESGQIDVLVVGPAAAPGAFDELYRAGSFGAGEDLQSHPGIQEALNGESGITYFQGKHSEHVVVYAPIPPNGWGLVVEEAWEDIASPYLVTTQSAPLVIVPIFLLAVVLIWFGAQRIVTPLQKLEKQAASLASGDFEAIRQPVGGIQEIRNLQIELVDMADKLEAAQHNLRSYIGAMTAGVENERRSLARELHDDTIQALIAFNQRIQLILVNAPEVQKGALAELQTLVQQAIANLRGMIRGLRPIYLEDFGLSSALEMLVREMGQSAAFPIDYAASGPERRLDPQSEMAIYRIVQESLNNVLRHAAAQHAWVELAFTDTHVAVEVRDDGQGFVVPSDAAEFPMNGHFGLLGLQERAELIKADLKIISTPGQGTSVRLHLPTDNGQA